MDGGRLTVGPGVHTGADGGARQAIQARVLHGKPVEIERLLGVGVGGRGPPIARRRNAVGLDEHRARRRRRRGCCAQRRVVEHEEPGLHVLARPRVHPGINGDPVLVDTHAREVGPPFVAGRAAGVGGSADEVAEQRPRPERVGRTRHPDEQGGGLPIGRGERHESAVVRVVGRPRIERPPVDVRGRPEGVLRDAQQHRARRLVLDLVTAVDRREHAVRPHGAHGVRRNPPVPLGALEAGHRTRGRAERQRDGRRRDGRLRQVQAGTWEKVQARIERGVLGPFRVALLALAVPRGRRMPRFVGGEVREVYDGHRDRQHALACRWLDVLPGVAGRRHADRGAVGGPAWRRRSARRIGP